MTEYSPIDEALRLLVCPRCEAKPGDPCVTMSGRKAEMHTSRWEPLALAYGAGYSEADAHADAR